MLRRFYVAWCEALTDRMARLERVSDETRRASDGLQSRFDARSGIEVVAQRVADEVERQHGQHHGELGKQYEVRCVEQVSAAIVEHGSPTGGGRRDAKSQKTHGSFRENGSSHANRGLDDDRLNDIGQNVADDDP